MIGFPGWIPWPEPSVLTRFASYLAQPYQGYNPPNGHPRPLPENPVFFLAVVSRLRLSGVCRYLQFP